MNQPRRLLVATDIFGATTALQQALAALQADNRKLEIEICQPDSCQSVPVFADDQLAYQAFVQQGGLERYQLQVKARLQEHSADLLLGFSAGAAALWCVLNTVTAGAGKALLCYGGQIRQYAELAPQWPVTCLWSDEPHFDVRALQLRLQQHPQLQQQHWTWPHGFINPHSKGYQPDASAEFWQRCQQWLTAENF
ncbi:hypothetical protein [Rheinheimera sp.]|uniref:hypothetical protein n=1 Tax=Rheinheimera sp. TaxID=1869214 RepID=UPI003D2C49E7